VTGRETSAEIESAAIAWVVRMERSDANSSDEAELARWIEADSRRRGAYVRARAAMVLVDRATVPQAAAPVSGIEDSRADRPSTQRRFIIGAGIAASVSAVMLGFALRPTREQHFTTELGEIKRMPLDDGSVMVLNTASRVSTRLEQNRRLVGLEEGEGWFHVAKDNDRPFIVTAGFASIQALGTAFSVRRRRERIDLLVTEGMVELSSQVGNISKVQLPAGTNTTVTVAGVLRTKHVSADDLMRSLAWQNGRISVNGETLEAAAEEFNRYNRVKIVVDPELAGETVVGLFDLNDPTAFARSAAATFAADITRDNNSIRLTRLQKKIRS
jgi:transmembrane sensor